MAGRGLKQPDPLNQEPLIAASPGYVAGRGLKHGEIGGVALGGLASPGYVAGRGLKPQRASVRRRQVNCERKSRRYGDPDGQAIKEADTESVEWVRQELACADPHDQRLGCCLDTRHRRAQPIKSVWIYPFVRAFRQQLCES